MTQQDIMMFSPEELFDKSNLLQVFDEETESGRFELFQAFITRSNDFKRKQEMKSFISAIKKDFNAELRAQSNANRTDFGHPNGELNCGNWIADKTGIRVLTLFGDKLACYHPILPIERLFNIETKTEKITLAYKRDSVWKEITVDKDTIASASKIVKLASYGISVTSETAKSLVQYLADVENLNEIPLKNSTSKFGWHGKDFIPYDTTVIFDDESRFKDLAASLRPSGSYELWLELVRKVRSNTAHYEPQVYLAASFASILVSKLNMLPFIVNLWGSTGKGKTVALMLAASIWADPTESKYITDSYATQNAFEIRLDILNHMPLLMDDLSKVRDKLNDNFTDLVYLLCSGKGKDRSNVDLGLNKVKTWQNTILSNMERPLATDTMKGGAINRILDFEMADGYIFDNGNHVVEILRDNYGWAGVKFIDLVKDMPAEAINAIRRDFEQKIKDEAARQGSAKEEKQILPMSLLLTADKMVTDYIFEDGIYLDLPLMVSQLKDVNSVSEGLRGYQAIMDYSEIYAAKFGSKTEFKPESWGYVEDGYLYVIPTIMRNIAQQQNFSVKAFCSWARNKHLLRANVDNQNMVKINNHSKRFYTIKMYYEEISSETPINTDKDEFQDVGNTELPFD